MIDKIKFAVIFFSFFTFAVFFNSSLFGQTKSEDENITAQFFKTFKTNPIKAYEDLFSINKYVAKSDIETTKIKMKDFLADLGDFLGYEQITTKRAGESYVLKSFLLKYDRQPIRVTFILYKPADTWKIQNFSYDANLSDELESAAKIDRLKENW